jgi:energy-coupling factor transporter ATP-binding protein EcfA2
MKTIQVRNVTLVYALPGQTRDVVTLFEHLSFDISSGEFIVLTGEDGSGKSSLTRLLNGLLQPTSGVILIDGMDTRDPSCCWEIRRRVGIIFQKPENQIVGTTVAEDVAFGPENLGLASEIIRERVHDALRTVGMRDAADCAPHLLNRVQQLKVSLAALLTMQPSCIVLDQATSGLDPSGYSEVTRLLQRLNRETGLTVLIMTHTTDEHISADRIIQLHCGRPVTTGVTPNPASTC